MPLRAALVGLGWWGRTILALLQGNAKLQVVHTVDANPAVAVSRIPFSTDYEEALRDPAVDAVVLANLEAFADAAVGRSPYPVPQAEMIANVSALEAIIRSAASARVEEVLT